MSPSVQKFAVATTLFTTSALATAKPLNLTTHLAGPQNFGVTSTLISGEKEAILVNAQFTRSEALRVAADILDSGKNLTTIFVSYGDPDYYFGLQTLQQFFPKAEIVATPATVKHIAQTRDAKLAYWSKKYTHNAPTETILPKALEAKKLSLEGQDIEIKGQDHLTYFWVPSLKAVIGGNIVTSGLHVWTADTAKPAERKKVLESLYYIQALKPKFVVPAHMLQGADVGLPAVQFSIDYLNSYEKAVQESKNSRELVEKMEKLYPNLTDTSSLELGAKVVKGEMEWQ